MDELENKLKIIDIQLIGTILFIVSLIVTLILTYNQKQYTLGKKTIFNNKQTHTISWLNRLLALGIVIAFLYSSYELREISKDKDGEIFLNDLDIIASILSVISAIIVLYIALKSPVEDALDIENPNI